MKENRVIMHCRAVAMPYPVLTENRTLECMIPVRAFSLTYISSAECVKNSRYTVRICDNSRWTHLRITKQDDCFVVCGRIDGDIITSESTFKMGW